MKRDHSNGGIPTLEAALSEYMNSDDLKKLAALTKGKLPTRKADLAAVIVRHLDGERLRMVWQGLDELQRAAVAEVGPFEVDSVPRRPLSCQVRPRSRLGLDRQVRAPPQPVAAVLLLLRQRQMPGDLKERLKAFVPPPIVARARRSMRRRRRSRRKLVASASDNALIVQSDCSVLLDVHSPRAEEARAAVAPFAELVKSPEHVHTYRVTPLSIWNARAAGLAAEQMVAALREHARYAVPLNVEQEVLELAARYGRVVITRDGDSLRCTCLDEVTTERLSRDQAAGQYLTDRIDRTSVRVEWRADREGEFPHLELFRARSWGLIIYDEVHLLPAPVFRATADLQARRRLGLTATLVREDGREGDVFALIFTLVSGDTREEEFAHHRKLFLTEQGYSHRVVIADER